MFLFLSFALISLIFFEFFFPACSLDDNGEGR